MKTISSKTGSFRFPAGNAFSRDNHFFTPKTAIGGAILLAAGLLGGIARAQDEPLIITDGKVKIRGDDRKSSLLITGKQPGVFFKNSNGKAWNLFVAGNGDEAPLGSFVFFAGTGDEGKDYRMVFGPDGGVTTSGNLHVFKGASKQPSTPFANLLVESNTNNYIQINSPDNTGSGIAFGREKSYTDGGIEYDPNRNMQFRVAEALRMTISPTGNVGIGTGTPTQATLVVKGSGPAGAVVQNGGRSAEYHHFRQFNGFVELAERVDALSIYASDGIAAASFAAVSDARIKTIEGRSDGAADLATLGRLEITDYRYKDVIGKGARPHKKVIAQQVETVYPQAVSRFTEVVPDIYENATVKEGWIRLETDLKPGERVRLIGETGTGKGIYEVLEVRVGAFRTAPQPPTEKVFVYGREVDDFRSVDYDAIAMLNVSATQQIKKEKDTEVAVLQQENAALRALLEAQSNRLTALEARDKARDAKLTAIEKQLSSLGRPGELALSPTGGAASQLNP